MITVYVDVLVGVNWFVNFFLLLGACKIAQTPFRFYRTLLSGFVLGCSSLTIFLPPLSALVEVLLRLGLAMLGVLLAMGYGSFLTLLKNTGIFFASTFAYGGITLGLWYVFHPKNMVIQNGVTYINLSPITLIVFTVIAYGVLWLIRKNFAKESSFEPYATLHIQKGEKTIALQAKVDTGFGLQDVYTGYPVCMLSSVAVHRIVGKTSSGYRLLPYETVNGEGLLKMVTLPNVGVQYQNKQGNFSQVSVVLGEKEFGEFDALIGYDFIERMIGNDKPSSKNWAKDFDGGTPKTNRLHKRLGNPPFSFKTRRRKAINGTVEKRG